MSHLSTYAEKLQSHSACANLIPTPQALQNYTYCPWAKCVVGIDPNSETPVLVGTPCKRWGCLYCATRKVRRLAWMTKNAEPNRLMTLTVNSDTDRTPKEVWDLTAPQVPELIRIIRKDRGECEYLRVLELHATGYPHYHLLMRSPFLPHAWLLKAWRDLVGPLGITQPGENKKKPVAGVNIEKVDKSFGTFRYLVKYLTKLHKIEWTDRHVSYSGKFFREEDKEQTAFAKLDIMERPDMHPWEYLAGRFSRQVVKVIGEGAWELPEMFWGTPGAVTRKELGLPDTEPEPNRGPVSATERKLKKIQQAARQRNVPGMEDAHRAEDF
jgi:hypothetical protein